MDSEFIFWGIAEAENAIDEHKQKQTPNFPANLDQVFSQYSLMGQAMSCTSSSDASCTSYFCLDLILTRAKRYIKFCFRKIAQWYLDFVPWFIGSRTSILIHTLFSVSTQLLHPVI
jgi:hypothetical protein